MSHAPQLDLMPVTADGTAPLATHTAVQAGDWFDPVTWANGQIPADGALVHIPAGVSVTYEGASDSALFMVRVDGSLTMSATNGAETKMVVDTMITSETSFLHVDADGPTDGTVDIVFQEGTPAAHQAHFADTSPGDGVIGRSSWDPGQLSLGLVASGEVKIEGQAIEGHLQLADGPMAGESHLTFDAALAGIDSWAPGQTLVIGGTAYNGRDADGHLMTEDEVRTITDIQQVGNQVIVTLDTPLDHDHRGPAHPDTGAEMTGYVANMSRNVNLSSAAADQNGDGVPERGVSLGDSLGPGEHYVTERGHVMFMHNDDVSVLNSGFVGLGRTDKSYDVDDFKLAPTSNHNARLFNDADGDGEYDPDIDLAIETPADEIMNQRGRYPLHVHMAGSGAHKHDHEAHDDHSADSAAPGSNPMSGMGPPLLGQLPGGGVLGPCADSGEPVCHCGDSDGDGVDDCFDVDTFVGHHDDHGGHDEFEGPSGALLEGNVVWGSPGWGVVHHSSDADVIDNVVFDVAGSAYVAESGDETGKWQENIAIGTYGARPGNANEDADDFNEDDGFQGNGFYMKSRALDIEDNVAMSSARAGFIFHSNGTGLQQTSTSELDTMADAAPGLDSIQTEDVAIDNFIGNVAIVAYEGLRISVDPLDSVRKFSDAYSRLEDFTAYGLEESGVSITYSAKYVFTDFLVMGNGGQADGGASAGFFFKASVADISIVDSHAEGFDNGVYNWTQIGDRQEYRRGYWDPKRPFDNPHVEEYEQLEAVGIDNPAHNLWNNNLVNVTFDDLNGTAVRFPAIQFTDENGNVIKHRGVEIFNTEDGSAANDPGAADGIEVELIGDSAGGGFVALWREDIANHPDQKAMLATHIPLTYNDTAYLSQIHFEGGQVVKRNTYEDYREGINADIWSGTVLEFSKTDSLGTQVFEYGDFSPMDPTAIERTLTTNEKIIFTKDMIDGVLAKDGYYTLPGHDGAKFVEMTMVFTDRMTGQWEVKTFLVGLDLAWDIPADALNLGTVRATDGLIIAPEYAFFDNGILDPSRPALTAEEIIEISQENLDLLVETQLAAHVLFGDGGSGIVSSALPLPPEEDAPVQDLGAEIVTLPTAATPAVQADDSETGTAGTSLPPGEPEPEPIVEASPAPQTDTPIRRIGSDGDDEIGGGTGDDHLIGGEGNDQMWGGDGADTLRTGRGADFADGGDGDDRILGGGSDDELQGGGGNDELRGGRGNDSLSGGEGEDVLTGGRGADVLEGGEGDDILQGARGRDILRGGDGDDVLRGGGRQDRLEGGAGDDRLEGGSHADELVGGSGSDVFVFNERSGMDVIEDFEDGVDAIEFMVQSFGFEDLTILKEEDDAVLVYEGGQLRLKDVDAADLDEDDFQFAGMG